jgi:pyridoxal phosphate enzyme (YggS family)
MYINQSIYNKLDTVCAEHNAQWIAVTKLRPVAALEELYAMGKRSFGENKAQELCDKYVILPKDIDWHFIGHLQTNKVKQIIDKVSTIHAVDSMKLLNEIQKEASKINKKVAIFIQMYVAQEETKYGFSPEEMLDFFDQFQAENYPNISIQGIMAMASFTDNKSQIEEEFCRVKTMLAAINSDYNMTLSEMSIGMSGDYDIALKCGATRLRIGNILFN